MADETTAAPVGGTTPRAPAQQHELARVRVPARSARSELRAIKVVWKRELIRFSRDRLRIVTSLIQPFLFLFVLGTGLSSLAKAGTHGVDFKHLHLSRRAVHGGDVHRHVLRRLDRVGPRVRVPA